VSRLFLSFQIARTKQGIKEAYKGTKDLYKWWRRYRHYKQCNAYIAACISAIKTDYTRKAKRHNTALLTPLKACKGLKLPLLLIGNIKA
jgi:hypothetical protein